MKHLTPVWFGIMLASGAIASSAVAMPTATQSLSQPATVTQTDSSTSIQQLTQFSDVLVAALYVGLPCSFLLAILVHIHREAQRQQLAARLVPIRIKDRS